MTHPAQDLREPKAVTLAKRALKAIYLEAPESVAADLEAKVLAAFAALTPPEGFVLVPGEPTEEMCFAGNKAADLCILDIDASYLDELSADAYRAMIQAAPTPKGG